MPEHLTQPEYADMPGTPEQDLGPHQQDPAETVQNPNDPLTSDEALELINAHVDKRLAQTNEATRQDMQSKLDLVAGQVGSKVANAPLDEALAQMSDMRWREQAASQLDAQGGRELFRMRSFLADMDADPAAARELLARRREQAARTEAQPTGNTESKEAASLDTDTAYDLIDAYAAAEVEKLQRRKESPAAIEQRNDAVNVAAERFNRALSAAGSPDAALNLIADQAWQRENMRDLTASQQNELLAMSGKLRYLAANPQAATAMLKRHEKRLQAEQADIASANVESIHEAERLKAEIAANYTSNMSHRICERGGDTTTAAEGFDYRQDNASQFWQKHNVIEAMGEQAKTITDVPIESVAFTEATGPVMERYVVREAKPRKLLSPEQTAIYGEREVGRQRRTVVNAETGKEEPAVYVNYSFDGFPHSGVPRKVYDDMPKYRETGGTRPGNIVQVQLELPESVANRLRQLVGQDPNVIRDLVDKVVVGAYPDDAYGQMNKRMNKQLWSEYDDRGDGFVAGRGRPPYENLPDGWKLHILEKMQPNGKSVTDDPRYLELHNLQVTSVPAPAQR